MSIRKNSVFALLLCGAGTACNGDEDPCAEPGSATSPVSCVPGVEAATLAEVDGDDARAPADLTSYPIQVHDGSVYFADPWGRVWQQAIEGGDPTRLYDRAGCAATDIDVTAEAVFAGLDCTGSDGVSRLVRIVTGEDPIVLREITGVWFSRIRAAGDQVFFLSSEHPDAGVNATSAITVSDLTSDEVPSGGIEMPVVPAAIAFSGSTAFWGNGEMIARTELRSATTNPLHMGVSARGEVDVVRVDISQAYVYWQECAANGCGEDTRRIRRVGQLPPATPEQVLGGGFSARALVHADVVYDVGPSILRWKAPDYTREVLAVGARWDCGFTASDSALFILGGCDGSGPARLTAISLQP